MDISQLTTQATIFLAPFMPYLMKVGEGAATELGKGVSKALVAKAKSIWREIQTVAGNDPKLNGIALVLAEDPEDEDYQVTFARVLGGQLLASPELANALNDFLRDDEAVQKVLVEQASKVKNIHQRLSKAGTQEVEIRQSQAGNITQEQ